MLIHQTRRLLLASACALALTAPLALSAEAVGKTLNLSSWLPPTHPIVVNAIEPWAEQVAEVTDGRVEVRVLSSPLGAPPAHFDLARDGVADITYGLHGYTPGRFVLSRAVEFPFLADSAEDLSVAYWNVYQDRLAAAGEHDGVHVLGLFTHGPGHLHNTRRPVTEVADLQGLKFRVPGGTISTGRPQRSAIRSMFGMKSSIRLPRISDESASRISSASARSVAVA